MLSQRELLRSAYAIVDGIPTNRINMGVFVHSKAANPVDDPKSQACAFGWLCFNEWFLKQVPELRIYPLDPKDRSFGNGGKLWLYRTFYGLTEIGIFGAVTRIFGANADLLFDWERADDIKGATDKEIWQARVRKYLKEKRS